MAETHITLFIENGHSDAMGDKRDNPKSLTGNLSQKNTKPSGTSYTRSLRLSPPAMMMSRPKVHDSAHKRVSSEGREFVNGSAIASFVDGTYVFDSKST